MHDLSLLCQLMPANHHFTYDCSSFVCLCVYLSLCTFVCLRVCLSTYASVYAPIACLSVCMSVCPSACPSACLSVCLSVPLCTCITRLHVCQVLMEAALALTRGVPRAYLLPSPHQRQADAQLTFRPQITQKSKVPSAPHLHPFIRP